MNLFASDEERSRVLVCSAAVALHALVSGRVARRTLAAYPTRTHIHQ